MHKSNSSSQITVQSSNTSVSLFVAGATFGDLGLSLLEAGAVFSDLGMSLLLEGAAFGDLGVSHFVAGAIFGDLGALECHISWQAQYLVILESWSVTFRGRGSIW